jgi:ABC-type lipoprotein release transport system permease subunit
MAIPLEYNVRSALGRPWATLATAFGIGMVVSILVLALALASGFRAAVTSTGSPDNVIVLRKGADSELSSGIGRDQANIVKSLPDIATGPDGRPLVSPELLVVINQERKQGKGTSNVTIRGVDSEGLALRSGIRIYEGRDVAPGAAELIVGKRIADRFEGFGLGQQVKLEQRMFTVVGHFSAGGSGFESEVWGLNAVFMPVLREDFQSVTFRMKNPSRFRAIKKQLEADPRLGVDVKRESDYYNDLAGPLATTMQALGVFIVLIMAVGALFAAMNTMFASIGARSREIATMLTLGFGKGSILVAFMVESILIALVGGVIGCLLALPVNGTATSTTNFSTFSEIAFAFQITPAALLSGMVFAFLLGVVGGFLPAWKASRQPLAAAMRAM